MWQEFPGITQTVSPFSKQAGHRLPRTGSWGSPKGWGLASEPIGLPLSPTWSNIVFILSIQSGPSHIIVSDNTAISKKAKTRIKYVTFIF